MNLLRILILSYGWRCDGCVWVHVGTCHGTGVRVGEPRACACLLSCLRKGAFAALPDYDSLSTPELQGALLSPSLVSPQEVLDFGCLSMCTAFLYGCWKSKLRLSCLHSESFTYWAIFPRPNTWYLETCIDFKWGRYINSFILMISNQNFLEGLN